MYYGPEYIGKTMLEWAAKRRITIIHIQPGNHQQNAYVERYNRTVRYDWLAQNLFGSLDEVQCSSVFYTHSSHVVDDLCGLFGSRSFTRFFYGRASI